MNLYFIITFCTKVNSPAFGELDDIDPEIATASEKSKVEAKARPSTGTSDWLLAVSSTQSMVPSLEK